MQEIDFFRSRIDAMINLNDPLAVLATRLPWNQIETAVAAKFKHQNRAGEILKAQGLFGATETVIGAGRSNAGRPRLAIRLMASLLYLKHSFNLSDEELVVRWSENIVWQFFSGLDYYEHRLPCDALGLLMDAGWGLPVDAEIATAVQDAARRVQAAGAIVEPLAPFSTREMADGINLFWRTRSWIDIHALPPERRARVLPFIRDWVAAAAGFSTAQLFHGYSQFAALRDAAVAACHAFDFVISPVAPVSAFAADWAMPTNDPLRAMEHIAFTLPFNTSEQPAISVPCAFTAAGLPIGLQIIGRRFDDLGVLRVARAWEQIRAPLRPWPQPP